MIDTSYDVESGVATYVISGATLSEVQNIQLAMSSSEIVNDIVESLEESIGEIINVSVEPYFRLSADVLLTIDATNTVDVNLSTATFEDDFSNDWSISSTCIIFPFLLFRTIIIVFFYETNLLPQFQV